MVDLGGNKLMMMQFSFLCSWRRCCPPLPPMLCGYCPCTKRLRWRGWRFSLGCHVLHRVFPSRIFTWKWTEVFFFFVLTASSTSFHLGCFPFVSQSHGQFWRHLLLRLRFRRNTHTQIHKGYSCHVCVESRFSKASLKEKKWRTVFWFFVLNFGLFE